MPLRLVIENLRIQDANCPQIYPGPALFSNFNPVRTDNYYLEPFPYVLTKDVLLRNVTTASGKPFKTAIICSYFGR